MRIDKIRLTNFRAFEELELALAPQLTVLVGRNGAGKTAILEGLAMALSALLINAGQIRAEDHPLAKTTPRLSSREDGGLPRVEECFPVSVEARGWAPAGEQEWDEITLVREFFRGSSEGGRRVSSRRRKAAEPEPEAGPLSALSHVPDRLPVFAFYGTGRLWKQGRVSRSRNGLKQRFEAYQGALDAGSDRRGFESWMAWREADRIQRIGRAVDEGRDVKEVRSPELEAISAAACGCLEGAKRIYFSENYQELRVDFEDGSSLPFDAISDGQRNLVALAGDIARRATQLNPQLGAEAASKAVGVVLIDEVDLHLHPAWQWRVLEDLTRAFPGIQFVVTTHSPAVMSSAPPGSVRLIDATHRVHRVDRITGKDVNSVLSDVFGVPVRKQKVQDQIDELARCIDDGRLAEAKTLLGDLARLLGEDDAKVVAARWELAMAGNDDAAD